MDSNQQGIIFNIQKFSVHDGKGIRTLVFLKGCPLRCGWCSNPESQKLAPERAFNPMRCIGADVCGRCVAACPTGAMSLKDGVLHSEMSRCTQCFQCQDACPSGAQTLYGETRTVDEVLRKVEEDEAFYARSGGGLTLSGGEVLMQPKFTTALLREAKRRYIHTAMETCGLASYETLAGACEFLDELMLDVKHANTDKHKKYTGAANTLILENVQRLIADFPRLPVTIRTPVVPGFNDTWEEIAAIYHLIPKAPHVKYELLEYHRMGEPKYEYLGRAFPYKGITADRKKMKALHTRLAQQQEETEAYAAQDEYMQNLLLKFGVKPLL